ncbi:MAG TPA: response regulator [Gammaproteobacteria bacterium]|nr:response regulator [Gammaproteobacteria bacterium]
MQALLVEDGRTDRMFHRGILERAGYTVREAANGYEGWEAALEQVFDLVVADINMPKLDGLALTRLLRDQHRAPTLPILLVSSDGDARVREEACRAGADAYLVKPLRPEEFLAAVRDMAGGRA